MLQLHVLLSLVESCRSSSSPVPRWSVP